MDNSSFIPGIELFPLTDEYDDDDDDIDRNEPMVDWIDDCQVQENLFQIIPLTPEEARCDKDNHIIQPNAKVFFEELGYLCDEPEPIDSGRNYEAEYKQQERQKYNNNNHHHHHHRIRRHRQNHVDLETMPTPSTCITFRHVTLDTVTSPGLSSTSSSFYHTDDDDDNNNIKSSTSRLSHLNHRHQHQLQSHSSLSKSIVAPSHFTFTSIRS